MQLNTTFSVSEKEKVLYFTLNWFDLSKEAQEEILAKAGHEMGPDNIFSFPTMEVRLLVRKEEHK